MAQVQIIRKDEQGETVKIFDNSSPYEKLKPGDVVEVEIDENGTLRDYFVDEMNWEFGHFGDTLTIHIQPTKPKPEVKMAIHLPPWSSNISHSIYLPRLPHTYT